MATLNVNYDQLESLGNNVLAKKEEFQGQLDKIRSTNENLKAFWQGEDAERYTKAVDEQAVTMQNLSNTIEEIGNFLKSASQAYRKAMEANRDAIKL